MTPKRSNGTSAAKGAAAVAELQRRAPLASASFTLVDLASLESIERCAARLKQSLESIDLLINNAAVMTPPTRVTTANAFELQFRTNYLGHFALTARLLPRLMNSGQARVVTLSSVAARAGRIRFDDLQFQRDLRTRQTRGDARPSRARQDPGGRPGCGGPTTTLD